MGGTENIGAIIMLINNFHVKLSSLNFTKRVKLTKYFFYNSEEFRWSIHEYIFKYHLLIIKSTKES